MNINLIEAHSSEITVTFKNPLLQDCTNEIKAILDGAVQYANDKNREIAKILGKVKSGKLYEADGFKSVDDYAAKTFGIKKANAYALAAAGEVYNDEKAPQALQEMSYSKLAELARADKDKVNEAVKAGKLTAEMTQKDIRDLVNAELTSSSDGDKPQKAEVIKTYKARFIGADWLTDTYKDTVADLEYWDTQLSQAAVDGPAVNIIDENGDNTMDFDRAFRKAEIIKLPKCSTYLNPNGDKKTVIRRLYVTDKHAITAEFYEAKKDEKQEQITVDYTKLSREELMEMLAHAQEALKDKGGKGGKGGKK